MSVAISRHPSSRLALLTPPHEELVPITRAWRPTALPPRGMALVWWLVDGSEQEEDFEWLRKRPWGLPLFVVLPPAHELVRAFPLLHYIASLDPKHVLPNTQVVSARYLRALLALPPSNLAYAVTSYLDRRGLLRSERARSDVRKILECVPEIRSISRLARRLYTSRRTLGRHFAAEGLPVPSHWLQFGRLLHAAMILQREDGAVFRVAVRLDYPDGFTLSNQMKRLLGCRPTDVRGHLGWEWIVETWIRMEARQGGFDRDRYAAALAPYLLTTPRKADRPARREFPDGGDHGNEEGEEPSRSDSGTAE